MNTKIWKNMVNFVNKKSMWNLQSIASLILIEVLERICVMPAPISFAGEDIVI